VAWRWLAAVLLAVLLETSGAAAQDVSLAARAGLGGLARPGRWAPVRIDVDSLAGIDGRLVLEWGGSRVTRELRLVSGARRSVELYIRAADVRDVITIRLESAGRVLASTQASVRLVGLDDVVTVCVDRSEAAARLMCTASVGADTAPQAWRGYDAADAVAPDATSSDFAPEQRAALQLWRFARASREAGATPMAGAVPAAPPPGSHAAPLLSLYPAALAALLLMPLVARRTPDAQVVVFWLVTLTASGAALTLGRTAPLVIHHASTVEAFEGVARALVEMRALAVFPSSGVYAVTGDSPGQTIDSGRPVADTVDQRFEDAGHPVLAGRAGLGERLGFHLQGTTDRALLAATAAGDHVRVSNIAGQALDACEWPGETGATGPSGLPAGASFLVPRPVEHGTVTCRLSDTPVTLQAGGRSVRSVGATIVALHLSPGGAQP